jgi:hypothetical protein
MKLPVKQIITAGIVGTVGIAGLTTAGIVSAEQSESSDRSSSLIDKIASTFNLDKAKVQEVFDTEREEREAKHNEQRAERLQQLVNDGTITAAQKSAIESKIKEIKAERTANKDTVKGMTLEERKSLMQEKRDELESWAKEQGIDLSELRGIFGGHSRNGGHGGPRGM